MIRRLKTFLKAFAFQIRKQIFTISCHFNPIDPDAFIQKQFPNRNFDASKKRGYIVYSTNYRSNSAGVRCLFTLCHMLNERGYPSFMTGDDLTITSPHEIAPIIDLKTARFLAHQGFIVMYPEVISGNPLYATHVCRWVLNRPGLLGGDIVYDKNEMVFYYSEVYRAYIQNAIVSKLHMVTIDEDIFFAPSEINSYTRECYYIGKSTFKEGYFNKINSTEITRNYPPKSELGHLLRQTKILYCFDNSTILTYEAILCGCIVVIIPDGTQTHEDYSLLELGTEGIAWGPEELPKTKTDPKHLHKRIQQLRSDWISQVNYFVEYTQSKTTHL